MLQMCQSEPLRPDDAPAAAHCDAGARYSLPFQERTDAVARFAHTILDLGPRLDLSGDVNGDGLGRQGSASDSEENQGVGEDSAHAMTQGDGDSGY